MRKEKQAERRSRKKKQKIKLKDKIKAKKDNGKGERNVWLRKKKKEVKKLNKSKRWYTCPSCKEFYKIKITNCVTIQQIITKFSQPLRYANISYIKIK